MTCQIVYYISFALNPSMKPLTDKQYHVSVLVQGQGRTKQLLSATGQPGSAARSDVILIVDFHGRNATDAQQRVQIGRYTEES